MSLCHQGLDVKLKDTAVTTLVSSSDPFVALANALDWPGIAQLAIPDLKRTVKGCWYLGRRLSLRSHLAVMILQTPLKETDRGLERRIRETPVLQVFCGRSVFGEKSDEIRRHDARFGVPSGDGIQFTSIDVAQGGHDNIKPETNSFADRPCQT